MATIYRYYDETRRLLYAGRTKKGIQRTFAHIGAARWWHLVASAEFHTVDDEIAPLVEKLVIWAERPVWNKALRLTPTQRQAMLDRLAEYPESAWISPAGAAAILGITEREVALAVRWGFLRTDYPRAMWFDHTAILDFIGPVEDEPLPPVSIPTQHTRLARRLPE